MTETGTITKGAGVVELDRGTSEAKTAQGDDETTLRHVMKSKGLSAVFDHDFVETDSSRQTASFREMDEQAKRVAKEASKALKQSVASNQMPFVPTYTGTESELGRFGGSSRTSPVAASSASLLDGLRDRNSIPKPKNTSRFASILSRIQNFVRRHSPTTDDLLEEFSSVPASDAPVFKQLLNQVAHKQDGRWRLKDT